MDTLLLRLGNDSVALEVQSRKPNILLTALSGTMAYGSVPREAKIPMGSRDATRLAYLLLRASILADEYVARVTPAVEQELDEGSERKGDGQAGLSH